MQKKRLAERGFRRLLVMLVQDNELFSGVWIGTAYAQGVFCGFLLQGGKGKQGLVRADKAVEIDAGYLGQIAGEAVEPAAFGQEGEIEAGAVVVNQGGIRGEEGEEGGQDLRFVVGCVGKPLDEVPGVVGRGVVNAADEVDGGDRGGEAGGFDVEKKEFVHGGEGG